MRPSTPAIERLLQRVVQGDGCWEWPGARTQGYGVIGRGGRGAGTAYCHRITYEHFIGPVPDGLDLDHLCRNRACCNPDHLEPVSRLENVRRGARGPGYADQRTHCNHGHEWTPENTVQSATQKRCRACHNADNRRRRARRKAGAA